MNDFGFDHDRTMYILDAKQQFGRPFLEVFGFTEGCGAVRDRKGAYFIDSEGKPLSQDRFRRTYPFYDGLAAVEDDLGMCHVDRSCRPAYTRRFGWVSDFHEGLCAVMYRNGTYTYIDREGNPWERTYRYTTDFSERTAAVLDDEGFTHIDTEGKPVHGKHFDDAYGYDHGLAPVKLGDKWFLIDRNGEKITKEVDCIEKGRNGLFTAEKGNISGYFTKDLNFAPLFDRIGRIPEEELPAWSDDILDRDWDSCVVFMRHSERPSHYLCSNMGIGGTGLTIHGEELARSIGKKIQTLSEKKVKGFCSVSRRCITTANCIMGGMGVPAEVEVSPEVGPNGTAFIYDNNYPPEEFIRPLLLSIYQQLEGKPLYGWYDNNRIMANLLELSKRLMAEKDSLTICVHHDLFVIPALAFATGRFARDQSVDYCQGCLFIRRGEDYFIVVDGKEYPMDPDIPISVDTSFFPSDTTMDLDPSDPVKGWQWTSPESIVWHSEPKGGMTTLCDRNGRFFHGRGDEYLAYNRTFPYAGEFSEQSAPVYVKGRGATHITDFGDLLHNRWFLKCGNYSEGASPALDGDGWHYIDVYGNRTLEGNFDKAEPFNHGKAMVFLEGKPCVIDRDGKVTVL